MHVHANAAISVDGKLASREREQLAISGPNDFERVDRLRASMDAVCVGVGTVLADDPSLTVPATLAEAGQPARVILDSSGRTPSDARVLSDAAPTYIVVSETASASAIEALETAGATVVQIRGKGRVDIDGAFTRLASAGLQRFMIEGGGELFYSMFAAELVDRLTLFVAPMLIGGRDAPTLVDGEGFLDRFPALALVSVEHVDAGVVLTFDVEGWNEGS